MSMENDNHHIIVASLRDSKKDWKKILELNELDNFNDCKLDDRGCLRNLKGHMLKGMSLNPAGKEKTVVVEDREAKSEFRNDIQAAVKLFLEQVGTTAPEDLLAFASLKQCKNKYELDDWAKLYMQYYRGKKASEDSSVTKKEIVITLGNAETTDLFKNLRKPIGEQTNANADNT